MHKREYDALYDERKRFDRLRQPSTEYLLDECDTVLNTSGISNPFGFKPYERLMECSTYAEPASIWESSNIASNFLYRIESIRSIANRVEWDHPIAKRSEDIIYRHIVSIRSQPGMDWIQLSSLRMKGVIQNPRSFSWWTDETLDPDYAVACSHNLGLPNDYIGTYALVLRIRLQDLLHHKPPLVPTTIHGYDSLFFIAIEENPIPTCGFALDLSDVKNLSLGFQEYVLGPVDVGLISCRPVHTTKAKRGFPQQWLSPSLLQAVLTYLCSSGGNSK